MEAEDLLIIEDELKLIRVGLDEINKSLQDLIYVLRVKLNRE